MNQRNAPEPITQLYWQPLAELLQPKGPKRQELPGFDDEFIDIVDYIIRITYRIWEQKNIGMCHDYYSDYCPVHTLGGYCDRVEIVVQNTLKTLAAFPDRSLIGENVIWSQEEKGVFYSSHRITSIMTNKGASEFGPATGKTGRVTTIADCVCKGNKIVYEWLMRDNSFLLSQLGIGLLDAATYQASFELPTEFKLWINSEYKRVRTTSLDADHASTAEAPAIHRMMQAWLKQLFEQKNLRNLATFYQPAAKIQWPGGRRAVGLPAIAGVFTQWLAQCPDAKVSLDHIAIVPVSDRQQDVAIRWALAGHFNPLQPEILSCKGLPFFVLAATHFEIIDGKIAREWTVFDEVALLANLLRQKMGTLAISEQASGGHTGV